MLDEGSGGFADPKLIMGLSMLLNPETDLVGMLGQMQQAQQQQAQQQLMAQKFQLEKLKFASDLRKDQMDADKRNTEVKEGKAFSDSVVGYEPTANTNWKGSGLLGDSYMLANHPLYTPNAPQELAVPEYMGRSKLDPITRARIMGSGHIARTGDVAKAHDALPEAPKPFTLSPGQQQYSPTGELIATNVDTTKPLENAKGLRSEFINQSKPFVEIQSSYDRIQAVAQKPSAAGDLAMIFNYMKMLDPGSAVREQEFANAQNAAGVPERVRALYNNTLSGQRLTKDTRADFLAQSNNLYQAAVNSHAQLANYYTELSNKVGVDPTTVIVDYRQKANKEPQQSTATPQVTDAHFAKLDQEMGFPPGKSKALFMQKNMSQTGGR